MELRALLACALVFLGGCDIVYFSPKVNPLSTNGSKVRVVAMTPESVMLANQSTYSPKELPSVFFATAGGAQAARAAERLPDSVVDERNRPAFLATRLPPPVKQHPYTIGVGDVLVLATPQGGNTVEQLTGLLAAQNARQGYTVQDDGSIAIPNVGRVQLAGLTLEQAESELFRRLVDNQIDPTFSLEISEFKSKKAAIGGAVAHPTVAPITLTPLYLDAALAAAGGITVSDLDYASIRIYRDGQLYQIPLSELYSNRGMQKIQLIDGDSVFVDTEYELDKAQTYFDQQIRLAVTRQNLRTAALDEMRHAVEIVRSNQQDARGNFEKRDSYGAVDRDYVYLTGEVGKQSRYALPFNRKAFLADALYDSGDGVPTRTANVKQIYVLRGSPDPREFGAVTAWQLNGRDASNFVLTTRFELRPNDVIFVAEQPVTKWSRVITQITPSLITSTAAGVAD
nr:polysaccharide biosynthesis/export family protein [Chachezhania sediminis]